jgi:hypothetical protein
MSENSSTVPYKMSRDEVGAALEIIQGLDQYFDSLPLAELEAIKAMPREQRVALIERQICRQAVARWLELDHWFLSQSDEYREYFRTLPELEQYVIVRKIGGAA